jgi:fatty acid CoA ligase FadD9
MAVHKCCDLNLNGLRLVELNADQRPEKPNRGAIWSVDRFRSAVEEAKIGPDKDIPHISAPIIVKYITNLQLLGLL